MKLLVEGYSNDINILSFCCIEGEHSHCDDDYAFDELEKLTHTIITNSCIVILHQ